MSIDHLRCEVLNASYEQLNSIPARRALRLYLCGKATVLSEHPSEAVHTSTQIYPVPIQIILNYMVKGLPSSHIPAQLNNRNLFLRDDFTCLYCGRHKDQLKKGEKLTRDHVIPKDLGGKDEWDNLVTACNKCNHRKANVPLEKTGMKLLKYPTIPTRYQLWNKNTYKNN